MITQPIVSICIPLYNAEKYIAETIRRVQQQVYPNIEIIIVDDHSTDGSLSIAKGFESERVKVYTNPKKGGNSARNYAFEMSTGEYIKFLDADEYGLQVLCADVAGDVVDPKIGSIQSCKNKIAQKYSKKSPEFHGRPARNRGFAWGTPSLGVYNGGASHDHQDRSSIKKWHRVPR